MNWQDYLKIQRPRAAHLPNTFLVVVHFMAYAQEFFACFFLY